MIRGMYDAPQQSPVAIDKETLANPFLNSSAICSGSAVAGTPPVMNPSAMVCRNMNIDDCGEMFYCNHI